MFRACTADWQWITDCQCSGIAFVRSQPRPPISRCTSVSLSPLPAATATSHLNVDCQCVALFFGDMSEHLMHCVGFPTTVVYGCRVARRLDIADRNCVGVCFVLRSYTPSPLTNCTGQRPSRRQQQFRCFGHRSIAGNVDVCACGFPPPTHMFYLCHPHCIGIPVPVANGFTGFAVFPLRVFTHPLTGCRQYCSGLLAGMLTVRTSSFSLQPLGLLICHNIY